MKPKRKRILLNENMFGQIHWEKDSGGQEQFELIINVKSMQEIKELRSQILSEHKEYHKLIQIKERLECTIKENQDAQKSTKAKLDKMDDIQRKNKNAGIDIHMYHCLEDYLDELASDEQELLSILKN